MQSQMFLEDYTFPGWRHNLQDLVRGLEEQFHHVDEAFQGALIYILIAMTMIILDWNDDNYLDDDKARLTDGCWSPTKISLFFTTRTDGFVEVGGKCENIREKFFSSNWGERKANNIIEDGIFFAQIFFSSDLGLPTQPETPNPYN